jgi:acyl-CoA synthetase (AMP-forming)/AMP-acid ligase II
LVLRSADELAEAEPQRWTAAAAPGDVAALFYTSGTTGTPKGVELTHRGLLGAGPRSALVGGLPLRHDEAVLALPVAHIMGFVALLGCACAGVPAYSFERFSPTAVLDAIEQRRASLFVGVPAMYRLLIEAGAEGRDLSSVRVWASGADVMPDDLARRFQKMGALARLPGVGPVGDALFLEGYGMAELAGAVAVKVAPPVRLPLFDVLMPGDALGYALPGYRLKIVNEDGGPARPGTTGELWVKGPGVTTGYWGNDAATADALTDDGWLRTGDLAAQGPLGSIRFAGRAKDVIKHGGYSVYALEIEEALAEHPAVAEAAALGLPDEVRGEVPVAAVRLVPGAADVDGPTLVGWAAERLADYKCPRQIVIVDDLPRTGSAKVKKADLRPLFTTPPPPN